MMVIYIELNDWLSWETMNYPKSEDDQTGRYLPFQLCKVQHIVPLLLKEPNIQKLNLISKLFVRNKKKKEQTFQTE